MRLAAVNNQACLLKYLPESLRTVELCLFAVWQDGEAFEHVPEHLRTAGFFMAAMQLDGWLEHLSESLKMKSENLKEKIAEMCMAAIRQNGSMLRYIPDVLKTKELCTTALQQCGLALVDVPEHLKTTEMCMTALKWDAGLLKMLMNNDRGLLLFDPEEVDSPLQYVPEALKTKKMCMTAVQQCGNALEYVPESLKTAEMRLMAAGRKGVW
jgi:hypothetical protein